MSDKQDSEILTINLTPKQVRLTSGFDIAYTAQMETEIAMLTGLQRVRYAVEGVASREVWNALEAGSTAGSKRVGQWELIPLEQVK